MNLTEKLKELLNDDIENLGYELVDIEFIGPKNEKRLIFYIYNESGINIDDCEKVSTFLDEKLDQLDLISTSYYLEVSSQDLSRPLKTDRDLIRNMNELLKVKLKDGSEFIAFTKEVNADNILFISQDDEEIKIDKSDIKEIKIEIVF
ncbi:ribosome maturation factor RimP [Anaerococcus sp. Marseille-P3915]|uniref:ribosome maturation factor RimP n=1 Tax=Anaerococcus sp. Marseille-P3915 TaxID=2057799 RepID=UPI000D0ACE88|nr:ribosome maturation factor RimP [Anaerococcus sp. Marseille-P3915]